MYLLREEHDSVFVLYFDHETGNVAEVGRLDGWREGSAANLRASADGSFLLVDRTFPKSNADLMLVEGFG